VGSWLGRFGCRVLVALVGALAVDALGVVAVGAEDLKPRRVAVFLEPEVHPVRTAHFGAVFSAVAIDVIDVEKFRRCFAAADTTVSAVSCDNVMPQLAAALQVRGLSDFPVALAEDHARQSRGWTAATESLCHPGNARSLVLAGTGLTHGSARTGRLVAPDAQADSCFAGGVGAASLAVLLPAAVTMHIPGGGWLAGAADATLCRDQREAAFVAVVAVVIGVVFHPLSIAFGTTRFKLGSFVPKAGGAVP
jgi:hypothetical protein